MIEEISITKEEYIELLNEARFLHVLLANGVDNWDYYEESLEQHQDNMVTSKDF